MISTAWIDYEGVAVRRLGGPDAYVYRTNHVALDADGSPRAYGPEDSGIDANANAGYDHKGWKAVLAVDPQYPAKPYIQPDGEFAGYFVSKTSLRSNATPDNDPQTYVNAETIPYIVFPGAFYAIKGTGHYGDLVMVRAIGTQKESCAIVADGGPSKAPLGEISLALAVALGGTNPDPRTGKGAPHGTFEYVVFPGSASAPAWPLTLAEIDAKARELLNGVGGWPS